MAIKSPKQKGSGGEYEVIALLTMWGNQIGVPLTLTRNLLQTREGGADINGVPGVEVEVKREESNGINRWWAQVCKAADKSGKVPMLAHRRNRQPWRFRWRGYVAVYGPDGSAHTVAVDMDLEASQMEKVFKSWLWENKTLASSEDLR